MHRKVPGARAQAQARARPRVQSYRRALLLTAILPDGAVGAKHLGVEHTLEVLDREVDGRCNGVIRHGEKLGPVVNEIAEQAHGAYESERAQRNRTDLLAVSGVEGGFHVGLEFFETRSIQCVLGRLQHQPVVEFQIIFSGLAWKPVPDQFWYGKLSGALIHTYTCNIRVY